MNDCLSVTAHQTNVIKRYGGYEFDIRMKVFPDGYHNLGFWKYCPGDRAAASRSLVWEVINQLELSPQDTVLDVGCGVGNGTVDLYQEYRCERVVGIDLTPDNVGYARNLALSAGIENYVEFEVMTATRLEFADSTFSKVYSVDCAVHFDSRDEFFKEVFRVLKPGGILVVADTCISKKVLTGGYKPLSKFMLEGWCVPYDNVYDVHEYGQRLSKAGLTEIKAESIGEHTIVPACDYFMSYRHWKKSVKAEGIKESLLGKIVFYLLRFAYRRRVIDYGMFVFSKP